MTTPNELTGRLAPVLTRLRDRRIAATSALCELNMRLEELREATDNASVVMNAVNNYYASLVSDAEEVVEEIGPELNLDALVRRRAKKPTSADDGGDAVLDH